MMRHEVFPPALRGASVEEQLAYLLRRKSTIERLLCSLEAYAKVTRGPERETRPVARVRQRGHAA